MPIDYNKYPPNWRKEIVPRILRRANNCCEKCGLKNKQLVYAVQLHVREGSRYKLKSFWFQILQDAQRAIRCFEEDVHWIRKIKVVLTIAHLDHDEENWGVSDDRLMAMCQSCHCDYDANEKYNRVHNKCRTQQQDNGTGN